MGHAENKKTNNNKKLTKRFCGSRKSPALAELHVVCRKKMNIAFEIHDSTLNEIISEGASTILRFNEAIIHRSEGEPGIDKGTCWVQAIEIKFENASILTEPDDIPNQLDYGYFLINDKKHTNVIKIPLQETGKIEAMFETFYRNELKIIANKIVINEAGEARYLQDFE
ncbi:hypothetical protein [Desulforhopalus sp. IMCC35007]|uniref:hypothetical protein n=1 Tax=Desulforhopalus sp. IMCC35007 TaxID=2569543 RepID=UPI0010ADCA6B|nr:hypothetical protein [Desulforhopalus sp. IMCC35007]TKB11151.1 hypothetical protein FCL48_03845 [Desulforhopalus sp. IMCC35007]